MVSSNNVSDITEGLIELIEEVSHDPEDADWFDVNEYIEQMPNTTRVLKELSKYLHAEYL